MAGASGGLGLPAPGHPPARLRAEESEAGIQARGLRALLATAGRGEAGGHAYPPDGAHPDPGAGGPGGRSHRGQGRAHQQRDLHPSERGWFGGERNRPTHSGRAGAQSRPQRPLPLRQWQEVQALPRQAGLKPGALRCL
nr:hypothetical protein [Caldimonas caldifontis]